MLSSKAKGFFVGAIAAASYGTNPLFALPLYAEGMNPDSVLFFRYLLAVPIMGLMLLVRRGKDEFKVTPTQTLQLFVMGILVAVSSLSLFISYTYMDAGIASTILFVYPIMVAMIMAIGFKEKFTVSTGLCIVMALAGIALLYKSSDGKTISLLGTMLVMVSSLTYALYIVGVNQTKLRDMPTLKVIFYVLLFGVFVFACKIILSDTMVTPKSFISWINLLGIAILPTAVSFLCTTYAIQLIGPTPTAILGALEPLTAVLIGVTLFGEVLTPRIALGIILILLAVSIVVAGGNFAKQITNIRKLFPRKR